MYQQTRRIRLWHRRRDPIFATGTRHSDSPLCRLVGPLTGE